MADNLASGHSSGVILLIVAVALVFTDRRANIAIFCWRVATTRFTRSRFRAALGASRRGCCSSFLTKSVLLALYGRLGRGLLAVGAVPVLLAMSLFDIRNFTAIGIIRMSCGSAWPPRCLANPIRLAPAWHASRGRLSQS